MSYEDRYRALSAATARSQVGHRLKTLRIAWEMSQSELARHVDVNSQTISQIEGGVSRSSEEVRLRLKAAFGITLDWLLFGDKAGLDPVLLQNLEKAERYLSPNETAVKRDVKVKNPRRPARRPPEKKRA